MANKPISTDLLHKLIEQHSFRSDADGFNIVRLAEYTLAADELAEAAGSFLIVHSDGVRVESHYRGKLRAALAAFKAARGAPHG